MKISPERCERHLAKTFKQQRLRVAECLIEGGIDGLFDEAAGRLRPMAHGQKRGASERAVDIEQRHLGQITAQRPSTTMPLFRSDIPPVPKTGQNPPDHHGIGAELPGERLGGHRAFKPCHVQQNMEYPRQPAVAFHATSNIA